MSTLYGSLVISPAISGVIANATSLSGSLVVSIGLHSTMTLPRDYVCDGADISLPVFTVYGEGYDSIEANASVSLPALEVEATGTLSTIGEGIIRLPLIVVFAEGYPSIIGEAEISLPRLTLSAKGQIEEIGEFSANLPVLTISAAGIIGVSGTFEETLPMFSVSATGIISVIGTANISLPMLTISASEAYANYLNMVMNIRNKALTLYDNYDFNSMCQFNGKSFGATETAIFDLDNGTTDNGTDIDWNFKTGYLDLHQTEKKKLRQIWFSYKSNGDIMLTVIQPDGEEYEYLLEGIDITDEGLRVKVGKGIRKNYLALDIKSVSGSSITLDTMALNFDKLGKIR
ncbi:MAG: hypothetical protein WC484_07455 [Candidatus Omnitrophota bacterium]|jgi:hypothetical protein